MMANRAVPVENLRHIFAERNARLLRKCARRRQDRARQ
jgi:hypothetical protein